MNLRTPFGRGRPGWPPRPRRVATTARRAWTDTARRRASAGDSAESTSAPAGTGFSGTHIATTLSWISSSVGISQSWIEPLPQPSPCGPGSGSTHRLGPPVVIDAVEIVVEHAVALQQAEAARIVVGEGRDHDARRIVERTPEPLAGAGPHRQPVGIVHFGTPVDGGCPSWSRRTSTSRSAARCRSARPERA